MGSAPRLREISVESQEERVSTLVRLSDNFDLINPNSRLTLKSEAKVQIDNEPNPGRSHKCCNFQQLFCGCSGTKSTSDAYTTKEVCEIKTDY